MISGGGALYQLGSGLTTLTASNSYTGNTVLSGGTLMIGNNSAGSYLASPSVAMSNSTALIFSPSDAPSYGGAISGSGYVVKLGSGSITLSGSNSYSGGTQINAGNLLFSTSSSLPPAVSPPDISIAFGAALGVTGPYTTVTGWLGSGRIVTSASGALALTGSSNETINLTTAGGGNYTNLYLGSIGTNSYSGQLTPAGSNYQLGGGGGTLVMASSLGGAYGAVVSGPGAVAFAANNTYSLGTTISSGTLLIGNGGGTGTLGPANVTDNGTLAFNRSDTGLNVANSINGSGAVTQAGSGLTVLTGSNTYTGVTTISAGTLEIGSGGNSGTLGSGNVVNNGTLVFGRSDAVLSLANVISGAGSVYQTNSGVTTLTGANTYSGGTSVASGAMLVFSGGATNLRLHQGLHRQRRDPAVRRSLGIDPGPEHGHLYRHRHDREKRGRDRALGRWRGHLHPRRRLAHRRSGRRP